ncbi:MAG: biotin--[acetyl-CoA-carboxylase] ligase [Chloroflexi bacterium]|nr:biotin--[acetyl-CoA-carboxylase] ligase [Chloroflexota bacterium]
MASAFGADWQTRHVATRVVEMETTPSTQLEARRMIELGDADGVLVIAHRQTAGRGRLGREWVSPDGGNLYLSFILRPRLPVSEWHQFTMMAALALAEAMEATAAVVVQLKWPNDLMIDRAKVAGILAEVADAYVIVGVGVNVNADLPAELAEAVSLKQAAHRPVNTRELLRRFVIQFDGYYDSSLRGATFEQAWAARLYTLGKAVRARVGEREIVGIAETVDATGALWIRTAEGTRISCPAGEVTLRW